MKHLSEFILENKDTYSIECYTQTGKVGGPGGKPDAVLNVSDDAIIMEFSNEYIQFYNEDDIAEIDSVNELDGKFIEDCENLKYGESIKTPEGTVIVRIKK